MMAQKRSDCHFGGCDPSMRHFFDFASQIFENNARAFFEAAIDRLPVPQPIPANVSLPLELF